MAAELQVDFVTAKTVYFLLRNSVGQVYNGAAFEAYQTANYASYPITATEQGAASAYYAGTMPAVAAGVYGVVAKQQAGGSPAEADTTIGTGNLTWAGSVVQLPYSSGAFVSVLSGQLSGQLVGIYSGQLSGQRVTADVQFMSGAVLDKTVAQVGVDVRAFSGQVVNANTALLGVNVRAISGAAVDNSIAQVGVNLVSSVSGVVQIASGVSVNVYSGQLSGQQINLLSGNQVGVWSGTQVNVFSGTSVNIFSGQLSGQRVTADVQFLSGALLDRTVAQIGTDVRLFSGQVVNANTAILGVNLRAISGAAVDNAVAQIGTNLVSAVSGVVQIASGTPVNVYSGQLSGQRVSLLSGNEVAVVSGTQVNTWSGQNWLSSGHQAVLYSGQQVSLYSGSLSGQKVDLQSGNQVRVFSGSLSGQQTTFADVRYVLKNAITGSGLSGFTWGPT